MQVLTHRMSCFQHPVQAAASKCIDATFKKKKKEKERKVNKSFTVPFLSPMSYNTVNGHQWLTINKSV